MNTKQKQFVVGNKVQVNWYNNTTQKTEIRIGTILQVNSAKTSAYTLLPNESYQVRWDDKPKSNDKVQAYEVRTPDTELEKEFREEFNRKQIEFQENINALLKIAYDCITEAESMAEAAQIPFHSFVSPLAQSYSPISLQMLYRQKGLSKEFLDDLLIGPDDYNSMVGYGWEKSAIC